MKRVAGIEEPNAATGVVPGSDSATLSATPPVQETLAWLESVLVRTMRRLMDSEKLDMPLFQLPLAQMRLAQALYGDDPEARTAGETMGRLSEKLGVRQNALTQSADRLISHGLAERLSDPNDRRIVRLRLTATGCEWVGTRRARRRARLQQLWNLLEPAERETFLQAVRTLETISERLETGSGVDESADAPPSRPVSTIEETLSRFVAQG